MREIDAKTITQAVCDLCIKANKHLPADLEDKIKACTLCECDALPKSIMKSLEDNLDAARELDIPICQDTGMAVVFAEIGQDVHIVGGSFEKAVNEGVARGYTEGYLRKSVVADPLRRVNTGDNTPAVIHTRLVDGDKIKITVAPKGFGSENMSQIKMLKPSDGIQGVKDYILKVVEEAGPNPCPPIVVGVGIGGTFEIAAQTAKRMTARAVGSHNADPRYAAREEELLTEINKLGVGPAGIGGATTALAVNIDFRPTHIASLPCAVNMCCHCARHAETTI